MKIAEVIDMLRTGSTLDDVFSAAENKAAQTEDPHQRSNVMNFAEARTRLARMAPR